MVFESTELVTVTTWILDLGNVMTGVVLRATAFVSLKIEKSKSHSPISHCAPRLRTLALYRVSRLFEIALRHEPS